VRIRFSDCLVSGYAHVFILPSVVVVRSHLGRHAAASKVSPIGAIRPSLATVSAETEAECGRPHPHEAMPRPGAGHCGAAGGNTPSRFVALTSSTDRRGVVSPAVPVPRERHNSADRDYSDAAVGERVSPVRAAVCRRGRLTMRRRRSVGGRTGPIAVKGAVVVLALAVLASVVTRTVISVQPRVTPNESVMHNVSGMIERLLDSYDMRLRPQFGGRYNDTVFHRHVVAENREKEREKKKR